MRIRSITALAGLVLLGVFTALNWRTFTTPTQLDLLVGVVDAPLGLVMLGVLAAVVLAFTVHMVIWQAAILGETRRHARELQEQRTRADEAEASRFNSLRAALRDEMAQLEQRMTDLEGNMSRELRENANSLAAMIGEMDERLRRGETP